MEDKYCLVISEKGLPVFVSMAMSKQSCETMMVMLGEGEIVPSSVGLAHKRKIDSWSRLAAGRISALETAMARAD